MTTLDENVRVLDGYLARFRNAGIANRIGGQDVPGSGGVFTTCPKPLCAAPRIFATLRIR